MKIEKREIRIIGFWNYGKAGEELGATYVPAMYGGGGIKMLNGPIVDGKTKYFRILIKLVKKD